MKNAKLGLLCEGGASKHLLERHLSRCFALTFTEQAEDARRLVQKGQIDALVILPRENAFAIFELISMFSASPLGVPVVFVGREHNYCHTDCCHRINGITCLIWDKARGLIESLQDLIAQSRFVNQIGFPDNGVPPRVKKARKFIHQNFTTIESATEVSKFIEISESTFLKEFRKYHLKPFRQYLIELRISYAFYLGQNSEVKCNGDCQKMRLPECTNVLSNCEKEAGSFLFSFEGFGFK